VEYAYRAATAASRSSGPLHPSGVADGTRTVLLKTTTSTSLLLVLDAWRDQSTRPEYLVTPTPFRLMKLPNLGIVVPIAAATGIGLLRERQLRWPWREAQEQTPLIACSAGHSHGHSTSPYQTEADRTEQNHRLTWPDPLNRKEQKTGSYLPKQVIRTGTASSRLTPALACVSRPPGWFGGRIAPDSLQERAADLG
jgi:hypothetical protein